MFTRSERIGLTIIILSILIVSVLFSVAEANDAHICWRLPTLCVDESPISECPLTGIEIQKQAGTDWIKRDIVAGNETCYFDLGLPGGPHFWRVIALSNEKRSVPSNIGEIVFPDDSGDSSKPAPNPPALIRITTDTNAYRVSPNWSTFQFVRGSLSGTVKLGEPCESRTTGDGYFYVKKQYITAIPGVKRPDYSVVKCSL